MGNNLAPYDGNTPLIGGGVFDEIHHHNPGLSTQMYNNRDGILTNPILPMIAYFRGLGDDEKRSAMSFFIASSKLPSDDALKYIARTQEGEATNRTLIKTLGAVEMNRKHESSESWREFLRQVGPLGRTWLEQRGETKRTQIHEYEETKRTDIHETAENLRTRIDNDTKYAIARGHEEELTDRTRIRQRGAYDIQRLKLEADVIIMEQLVKGQIHLSDNQLKATHIEATALRDSILGTERVRAETQRRISKDKLIGLVREVEFKYLTEMGKAEYLWRMECKKTDDDLFKACLAYHSELFRAQLEYFVEISRVEERREKHASDVFKAFYGFLGKSVDLSKIIRDLSKSGRKIRGITIEGNPLNPDFELNLSVEED